MRTAIFITLSVINVASLLALMIFQRATSKILQSSIKSVGQKNRTVFDTPRLKHFRIAYFTVVIFLITASYYFFWH